MPPIDFGALSGLLGEIIGLGVTIGAILAFATRQGYMKQTDKIKDNLTKALEEETKAQNIQIRLLQQEIKRLKRVLATVQKIMEEDGKIMKVNGEYVRVTDTGTQTKMVPIIALDDEDNDAHE